MSDATDARNAEGVWDALIAGRSLPALLAALDLAEVGLSVAVANGPLDLPSEAPRDPEGGIAAFVQRIASPIDAGGAEPRRSGSAAPRAELSRVQNSTPWLLDPSGAWAPQSTPSVLGIPAVPIVPENLRLLGTGGAVRAYMDRVKPVLTIGKTRTVGDLVRARLGAKAFDRLIDPLVRERYGVSADEVDVAVAVPGLNEALSRAGSLSAAVYSYSDRYAVEESGVEPVDGWEAFAAAVIARLSLYEVRFLESTVVGARFEGEAWQVELADGDEIGSGGVEAVAVDTATAGLQARSLVIDRVGTDASERLIADLAPGVAPARHRSYAEVDIQSLDELPDDAVGVRALGEGSLAIGKAVDGVRRARFSSPVKLGDRGELGRDGEAGIVGELAPALRAAGLEISEGAAWRAGLEAAPHATLEQRHRVDDALAVIAEAEEPLLPVGRELHGGDLSAALDAAHRGSVELRRRLLGLSE